MVKFWWLCAWLLAIGCDSATTAPPTLRFDGRQGSCSDISEPCLNAGASAFDVAGLRVIHKRLPGNPIVVASVLFDRRQDLADPVAAHAQALVMRMISWWGAQPYLDNWDDELGRLGASQWSTLATDYAHTGIIAPAPNFEAAWHMLSWSVREPPLQGLSEQALERIKIGYRQELETFDDDAAGAASSAGWSLISEGHPYNSRARPLDALDNVRTQTLLSSWNALRQRPRMTVVVVGDIERARVEQLVRDKLASVTGGATREAEAPIPPLRSAHVRTKVTRMDDAPSWQIYGYFPAPAATDAAAFAALTLGARVLSDRLWNEVRDQLGLAYSVQLGIRSFRANYGTLTLSTVSPAAAMQRVREVVHSLLQDGMDDAELDAARATYTTQFLQNSQSAYATAVQLGDWELTAGDRELAESHLTAIADVTAPEALAALASTLPGLRFGAAGPGAPLDEPTLVGDAEASDCEFACTCRAGDPGAQEVCNERDDDCDGKVDETTQNACGACGPLSLEHCPNHHTLFISSTTLAPTFGSLAEADRQCQSLATQAGRDGTWRALLVDSKTALSQRIHITKPVFNTRAELVAATSTEFFSGRAQNSPSVDERGMAPRDTVAWVGSSTSNCLDWTSTATTEGGQQALSTQKQQWLYGANAGPCNLLRSLYCIDQD